MRGEGWKRVSERETTDSHAHHHIETLVHLFMPSEFRHKPKHMHKPKQTHKPSTAFGITRVHVCHYWDSHTSMASLMGCRSAQSMDAHLWEVGAQTATKNPVPQHPPLIQEIPDGCDPDGSNKWELVTR